MTPRKPKSQKKVMAEPDRMTCNYCRRVKDASDMAYPHVCADCYYDKD